MQKVGLVQFPENGGDACLEYITGLLTNLVAIDLSFAGVKYTNLNCIVQSAGTLRHLSLRGTLVDDSQLHSLCTTFADNNKRLDLVSLDLSKCNRAHHSFITDYGFSETLRCCNGPLDTTESDYSAKPRIFHLDITGTPGTTLQYINLSMTNITNESLLLLSVHCVRLKKLLLQCCNQINDKGVATAVKAMKDLLMIDIGGCLNLTEEVLHMMNEANRAG